MTRLDNKLRLLRENRAYLFSLRPWVRPINLVDIETDPFACRAAEAALGAAYHEACCSQGRLSLSNLLAAEGFAEVDVVQFLAEIGVE
jgi:hypothetical protein